MNFKPNIGDVFLNKYEVVSLVGEGAFGCVYRARDIKLDRIVAMKFIHAEGGMLERFADELEAIKNLDHPNIVRLYDYDIIKNVSPCFVMEFVNGREVGDILCDEGTFDMLRICEISLQVLDALVETHKHGIVHCDLKPENIMLTSVGARKDVVKLIDFGVASILSKTSEERQKMLVGTPQYMAPEQIRHDPIGPWTDIYALGLIMIELYTGQFVFDHEDPREVLRMQLYTPVELPPQLANSVVGPIIRKAIEKDVNLRYRSTQQFYDDVHEATQILQTEAREARVRQAGVIRGRAVSSLFCDLDEISSQPPSFASSLQDMSQGPMNLNFPHADTGKLRAALGGMTAPSVPLLSQEPAHPSKPAPEPVNDLGFGLDLSSLQNSIGNISESNESLKEPGRSAVMDPVKSQDTSSDSPAKRSQSVPNLSLSGDPDATPSVPLAQKISVVDSNLAEAKTTQKKYVPEKPQKKGHLVAFVVVIFVLLSLAIGGYYVWRTGILANVLHQYGIETPEALDDDVPVAPTPVVTEEPAVKPVVRFSTIRDAASTMAYVAAYGSIAGTNAGMRKYRTYRVIGTPLEGHIFVNDSLVCFKTPCNVHVFGNPADARLEIRHNGLATPFDLAKHNPSNPVILVLKK